jgi:cytidylate kinase
MPVIAMTREMGTLGKDVAAGLAESMGMEIVHHELVEQRLAERLQLGDSAVHRFLEGRPSLIERWKIDSSRLSRYTAEEILEIATKGKVLIRGWGAAQLLADVPHVICVRVCAPMQNRIQEMMQRLGLKSEAIAAEEIKRNDDAHARTIQRQFAQDWRDPLGYDIVLNTGRIPIEACIAQLRSLAQQPAYQPTDASRRKLKDKLIEARVRTALDRALPNLPYGGGPYISVVDGVVTISGVVSGINAVRPAFEAMRKIDGVTEIRDNLAVVNQGYGI